MSLSAIDKIVQGDGINKILTSMKRFPNDKKVQVVGCNLLLEISEEKEEYRTKIIDADVLKLLQSNMKEDSDLEILTSSLLLYLALQERKETPPSH